MALADLLGMAPTVAASLTPQQLAALTPEQLAALPNVQVPQPQQPQQPQQSSKPPHGFLGVGSPVRNFIGAIGDALSMADGGPALYAPRLQARKTQSALQNYLVDPNGAIANLMKVDAPSAITLMQAAAKARLETEQAKPDAVRELIAAGIDPSSPEGQAALKAHLGKSPAAGIAEYQFYRQNGGTLPFADFLRIIHPPGGGTFEEAGPPASPASPAPALRLNPSTGQWEPER